MYVCVKTPHFRPYLDGRLYLLPRRVQPPVADVVEQRVVEEAGVLRDDADGLADGALPELLDVLPVFCVCDFQIEGGFVGLTTPGQCEWL